MRKPVIGLTGVLGSGKSAAAKYFAGLGARVIDMDKAGRWAVDALEDVQQKLALRFGDDIIDEEGRLQRRRLGEIVFADAEALTALNAIVHPAMLKRVRELIAETQTDPAIPYIVVDAALIFELQFEQECDAVVVVSSPIEMCLQRAARYKKLSRQQALQRIQAQLTQEKKIARADFVIENTGTLGDLSEQVKEVNKKIIARFNLQI